jgi:sensor histidine kinase YesM
MEEQHANEIDLNYYFNFKTIFIDYVVTIIICTVIALVLTLANNGRYFLNNFVMAQSFGIIIRSIILFAFWIFKPKRWMALLSIITIAVFGGAFIGLQLSLLILQYFFHTVLDLQMRVLQIIIITMIFSIGVSYYFIMKTRMRYRNDLIEQKRMKIVSMQKEALEANLRLLQAQIEPHFLFNTLSNILSLIDTEPTKCKTMLVDLTKYLRTSLSRTLPEKTTLSQEIDMIKAYLNIQKIRMGERLKFRIEIPEDMCKHLFPPMLLQPLVENAVKHGLEPTIKGGEIIIKAARNNDIIRIEVADNGLGFSSLNKTGVGIGNVKERIKLLYGERGCLIIEENMPHGVRAVIEVPKYG